MKNIRFGGSQKQVWSLYFQGIFRAWPGPVVHLWIAQARCNATRIPINCVINNKQILFSDMSMGKLHLALVAGLFYFQNILQLHF